jgi:hypothetical protein
MAEVFFSQHNCGTVPGEHPCTDSVPTGSVTFTSLRLHTASFVHNTFSIAVSPLWILLCVTVDNLSHKKCACNSGGNISVHPLFQHIDTRAKTRLWCLPYTSQNLSSENIKAFLPLTTPFLPNTPCGTSQCSHWWRCHLVVPSPPGEKLGINPTKQTGTWTRNSQQ